VKSFPSVTADAHPGGPLGICSRGEGHYAPVDPLTGIIRAHPTAFPLRDVCEGTGSAAPPVPPVEAPFFEVDKTYRNPVEGTFLVKYIDTPPTGYEHHTGTLGVAFGWRMIHPDGHPDGEPDGAYTTPDFHGWREI
jgi:hypothetical protein